MSSLGTDSSSLAIGFSFPILGGICVALRFYTRSRLKNKKEIDDWLCIPAWLCVTGCCASLLTRAFKDSFVDDDGDEQFVAQVLGALAIFWAFANALIKLSILFFYRRVFRGPVFNIVTWILIALSILWLVYDIVCWLLYCGTDIRANFEGPWFGCPLWGFEIQMGVFVLDSLIDFSVLVLPIPFVWRLQLGASKKVIIMIIFLLGGFAFVAGLSNTIIQLVYLVQPDFAEDAGGSSFFQGTSILIYNWPTVEVGVGLIACNLPSLSFRVASSLPKQMKRIWDLSLSKVREHTSVWSSKPVSRGGSSTSDSSGLQEVESHASITIVRKE